MKKIFVPTTCVCDWKELLAEPDKQWAKGYSARTLANCWEDAAGNFPKCVQKVFNDYGEPFNKLSPLLIFPEYKVNLDGGSRASQNDIWVLAKDSEELYSIAIEGKVSEPFDLRLKEWSKEFSKGKKERWDSILKILGIDPSEIDISNSTLRYQLFHRTASAILEARKFNAKHAMLLVHSFSKGKDWFEDYSAFLSLFGFNKCSEGKIYTLRRANSVILHFAWVVGDTKYLNS